MSDTEVLCESLDNLSHVHKEKSNRRHSAELEEKIFNMDLTSKPKPKEDSMQDSSEAAITESYREIYLKEEIIQNSNSQLECGTQSHMFENVDKYLSQPEVGSEENSERDEDIMTGSYGEISFDRELLNCDKSDSPSSNKDENLSDDIQGECLSNMHQTKRPDSLIIFQNVFDVNAEESASNQVNKSQQTSESNQPDSCFYIEHTPCAEGDAKSENDSIGLSELQGTLVVDGEMLTFVAEDLQEKIRMSSPISQWEDSSFPCSQSSTPSLYCQALQPNQHIIDPNIIVDLEAQAKKVATCVDVMLENLSGTLQSISSLTVDCMETYESSICKTCDAVDLNIKAVYQLMAKCEELGNSMTPLYKIAGDVKHIKKMLDLLEHTVEHKS